MTRHKDPDNRVTLPSEQTVENSQIRGAVDQFSDVAGTKQRVAGIRAAALRQRITSLQNKLGLGSWTANGTYAVIGLVIISLAYFAFRSYISK
jgi:hypothetical protein